MMPLSPVVLPLLACEDYAKGDRAWATLRGVWRADEQPERSFTVIAVEPVRAGQIGKFVEPNIDPVPT